LVESTMTTRRPGLNMGGAIPPQLQSVKPVERADAASVTQVPKGLDRRGFQMHRLYCRAGVPRCSACIQKFKDQGREIPKVQTQSTFTPMAKEEVNKFLNPQARYQKTVKIMPPLGAGVSPGQDGNGIEFLSIKEGAHADLAHVHVGDVVQSINGFDIRELSHALAVAQLKTNQQLTLVLSTTHEPAEDDESDKMDDAVEEPKPSTPLSEYIESIGADRTLTVELIRKQGQPLGMSICMANSEGQGLKIHSFAPTSLILEQTDKIVPGTEVIGINGVLVATLPHPETVPYLGRKPEDSDSLVFVIKLEVEVDEAESEQPVNDDDDAGDVEMESEETSNLAPEPLQRSLVAITMKPVSRSMGVQLTSASSMGKGLRVNSVGIGSHAADAGVLVGDEIISINGAAVDSMNTAEAFASVSTMSPIISMQLSRVMSTWSM